MSSSAPLVLVTGAAGFVATHCIVQLLEAGYRVRGTLRDLARADGLARSLAHAVDTTPGRLSFAAADLGDDEGWARAVDGCTYVLHVASPVPRRAPASAEEVIAPARDGALRVLRAASAAGVRRVVMTSSTSAVLYGHARDGSRRYDERDWTRLTPDVGPYERSKTLAERAAWDYVRALAPGRGPELVVLNPGLVLGPLLTAQASVSGEIVRKLLQRELPGCPDLGWAPVDVRDVAAAHVAALTHPHAAGERFILALEHAPMVEIARLLERHFGPRGFRIPTRAIPSALFRIAAVFDRTAALAVPELGKRQDVSSDRARLVLGWRPRTLERMVVDMAESMLRLGLVAPAR